MVRIHVLLWALARRDGCPKLSEIILDLDFDRVHLRDLLDVGLVDASWLERMPPTLRARLQELLDNPEG